MRPQLNIERVENILEWLEKAADDYTGKQSISWYVDQVGKMCVEHAFVNGQMAEAKRQWQLAKREAYRKLEVDPLFLNKNFSPSLAKEYISACCENAQYNYEISERCSRTLSRQIEALRTCISGLKEEVKAHLSHQNVANG